MKGNQFYLKTGDNEAITKEVTKMENYQDGVVVNGTSGDDAIENYASNVTINAGAGNDEISSYGDENIINGGAGNDQISANQSSFNTIDGGDGDDDIYAEGESNSISGGAGNDIITAEGDGNHTIDGGAGNDEIQNYSSGAGNTFQFSGGNDTIYSFNSVDNLVISGTYESSYDADDGAVVVSSSAGSVTLVLGDVGYADTDQPIIKINGQEITVSGAVDTDTDIFTAGDDFYDNTESRVTLDALAGNDTVSSRADSVSIFGGAGNDVLEVTGSSNTLTGGAGTDRFIFNGGSLTITDYAAGETIQVKVDTTDFRYEETAGGLAFYFGRDSLFIANVSASDNINLIDSDGKPISINSTSVISLTGGADTYSNAEDNATIYALGGNDAITNTAAAGVYIDLGAGNDSLYSAGNLTVLGGDGNDFISLSGAGGSLIRYSSGNDIISGFKTADTLEVSGDISSASVAGSDVVLAIGKGSVTLKDKVDAEINLLLADGSLISTVIASEIISDVISLTSGADDYTNKGDSVTIDALAGNDTIYNSGSNVSINGGAGADVISLSGGAENVTIFGGSGADTIYFNGGGGNVLEYSSSSGNDILYGYGENDRIKITAGSYTTSIRGGDFIVKVGSVTLTLKDAVDNVSAVTLVDASDKVNVVPIEGSLYPTVLTNGADKATFEDDGASVDAAGGSDLIVNIGNNSSIYGNSGNDTLANMGSNVTLSGGAGNDVISLSAESGGNRIQFGNGDGKDTIYGFGENDSVEITSGATLKTAMSGTNAKITVGSSANILTFKDIDVKNLQVVDGFIISLPADYPESLTSGADKKSYEDDGATVYGLAGNDTISSSGIESYIDGGAGADKLYNSGDNSTLIGGAGNDVISLSAESSGNWIKFGTGDGKDTIYGFGENDSVEITSGATLKTAMSGTNAKITVGSSANVLTFKDVDVKNLQVVDGFIVLVEPKYPESLTNGADNESYTDDGATVYGLAGNDIISSSGIESYIDGGAGADKLYNTGDNSTLIGGAGNDVISLSAESSGNWIKFGTGDGKDTIYGFGENDSVEITSGATLNASQSGTNAKITVGSSANVLTFKDVDVKNLQVVDGFIVLVEPKYPESLTNGADNKSYTDDGATVYGLAGNDTISSSGIESYIDGGAGADKLYNTGDNSTLVGGAGNDTLLSGGSENVLYGGAGADRISLSAESGGNRIQFGTGDGKDTIYGFGENDTVEVTGEIKNVAKSGANVLVTVGTGTTNVITFKDIQQENLTVVGSQILWNDGPVPISLTSSADKQTFSAGNETVYALGGSDSLTNTGNNSYLDGGAGADKLYNSGNATTLIGGAGNDTISNSGESAEIFGGADGDFIISSGVNVYIDGGAGADRITLDGQTEGTTIVGGAGADSIYLNDAGNIVHYAAGDGKDSIYGFGENDIIEVTTGTIAGKSKSGDNVLVSVKSGSSTSTFILKDMTVDEIAIEGNKIIYQPEILRFTEGPDDYTNATSGERLEALGGNDTVYNSGANVYIDGGAGNDQIFSSGNEVTLLGGAGKDTLTVEDEAESNVVNGGAGDDIIYLNDKGALIEYSVGGGKDSVYGFGEGDSIVYAGTISKQAVAGGDYIFGFGSGSSIRLVDISQDELTIDEENKIIYYDADPDPIIVLTEKADTQVIDSSNVTVKALGGNDKVTVTGSNVYISGDAGADKISVSADSENNTLVGGVGADTIYSNGTNNVIQYAEDDGKDVIVGFGGDDSIEITSGEVANSLQSGANMIVTVNRTTDVMTIKGANVADYQVVDGTWITKKDGPTIISGDDKANNLTNNIGASTILAYGGNDTITNQGDNAYIEAGTGNDTVYNTGSNVYIDGGADGDRIYLNGGSNVTVNAGAGADTVYSNGNGNIIEYASGGGKDVVVGFGGEDSIKFAGTITKQIDSGSDVKITFGSTSNVLTIKDISLSELSINTEEGLITTVDSIFDDFANEATNDIDGATLDALGGNDTITNGGNSVLILGGAGNDKLYNTGNEVTIDGGAGKDTISVEDEAESNIIIGGEGDDVIYTNGKNNEIQYASGDGKDTIFGFSGDDSIIVEGTISRYSTVSGGVRITVGSSSNLITIKDVGLADLVINKDAGVITAVNDGPDDEFDDMANEATNSVDGKTLDALGGNDTVTNSGAHVLILGGAGADSLINSGNEVTIDGGADNDIIESEGNSVSINGGAGADVITLNGGANVTVAGGAGADKIYGNDIAAVYKYGSGDGNDYIYGFGENATLAITSGSISSLSTDGENGVVKIGSGFVTLGGAGSAIVNIVDADGNEDIIDFGSVMPTGVSMNSTGKILTAAASFKGDLIDVSSYDGTEDVEKINASELKQDVYIIGNGNDNSIVSGAGDDTLYGGKGDDTLDGGSKGNDVFYYSAGVDVIKGYTPGYDVIQLEEGVEIDSWYNDGANLVLETNNNGSIIVISGKNKEISYADGTSQIYTEAVRGSSSALASDLFVDDNFITDVAQIDSISEITAANYSVGKLDNSAGTVDLAQNDSLSSALAYSQTK